MGLIIKGPHPNKPPCVNPWWFHMYGRLSQSTCFPPGAFEILAVSHGRCGCIGSCSANLCETWELWYLLVFLPNGLVGKLKGNATYIKRPWKNLRPAIFLGKKGVAFGGGGPFKFSWKFFSVYSGGYIGVGVIGRCDEQILRGYFPITVFWNLFLTFTRISTVNQQARPNSYPFSCSYSYQNVAS